MNHLIRHLVEPSLHQVLYLPELLVPHQLETRMYLELMNGLCGLVVLATQLHSQTHDCWYREDLLLLNLLLDIFLLPITYSTLLIQLIQSLILLLEQVFWDMVLLSPRLERIEGENYSEESMSTSKYYHTTTGITQLEIEPSSCFEEYPSSFITYPRLFQYFISSPVIASIPMLTILSSSETLYSYTPNANRFKIISLLLASFPSIS